MHADTFWTFYREGLALLILLVSPVPNWYPQNLKVGHISYALIFNEWYFLFKKLCLLLQSIDVSSCVDLSN